MSSGVLENIKCRFSLFEEGRKYSGNHRKYIVENAREICYSPQVREQIKLREALGFYGHGIRQKAGRLRPQEYNYAQTPGGNEIEIMAVPSNVTTAFEIEKDGTVTHAQDVLDTPSGRIVHGLHKSQVGGFSWACHGVDGGASKPTELDDFAGFDYVLQPDFSHNRGYVLESAANVDALILECVRSVVKDEARAKAIAASWRMDSESGRRERPYRDALYESRERICELEDQLAEASRRASKLIAESAKTSAALKAREEGIATVLKGLQESLPFFIPDRAVEAMLKGDFSEAKAVFESARNVDFWQFPLGQGESRPMELPDGRGKRASGSEPDVGTAEFGFGMVL